MRPPAPRTAWHSTQRLETKRSWPRAGSPMVAAEASSAMRRNAIWSAAATPPLCPRESGGSAAALHKALFMGGLRQIAQHTRRYFPDRVLAALADLPDRDDREELREEGVEEDERAHERGEERPLHPRRDVRRGGHRQARAGEARHDDEEALQPHPDLYRERRQHRPPHLRPRARVRQQRERHDEAGDDHRPEERRELPFGLGKEDHHVHRLAAVVRRQELGKSEVKPEETHDQEEDAEVVEVDRLEVLLEVIDLPDDGHGDDDRGDAGEDRPDHEVGTEDGGVPHRLHGHGEDPRHYFFHEYGDDHGDLHYVPTRRAAD